MLNLEQPFSAAHRVGLLFSLPGSTMLDTLVGLLLATCLAQERLALDLAFRAWQTFHPPPPPVPPRAGGRVRCAARPPLFPQRVCTQRRSP